MTDDPSHRPPGRGTDEPVRERVRHAVARLEEIRLDLWEIVETITLPPVRVREDGFDLAGLSELDAVVRCALHDHMKPMIESLRGVACRRLEELEETG